MPTSRSRIDLSTLHSDEPKKITLLLTQSEFSLLEAACQITGHKPPELLVELFRTEIKPKLARTLSDLRKETEQQASSGQAIVEILTAPIPEPRRSAPLAPAAVLNIPMPLGSRVSAPNALPSTSSPIPAAPIGSPGMARPSVPLGNLTATQPAPLNAAPAASPTQPPSSTRSTPEPRQ